MEKRNELIKKILLSLKGKIPEEHLAMVDDAVTIALDDYEVTPRCTEVLVKDDSAIEMLKLYIASKNIEGLSPNTLRRYWGMVSELLRFLNKPVDEITAYDIRLFLSVRRQEKNLANRTLDGMRLCYSSFFAWLNDEGYISRNPCASVKQIKYKKDIKKPFSPEEIESLRMGCKSKRDLALVDFLLSTGCRVSEVSELDIKDIDFDKAQCTVLGKGNKERIVYISAVAMMHLKEYLRTRTDDCPAVFAGWGKRLSKRGIEKMLERLSESTGVEDVYPHRFRRTLATNLLDRGMSIQDVAIILGHADLRTTQIYCYISQESVQSAYKKYGA